MKTNTAKIAVKEPLDDRSLLARAAGWASNATTISVEMVVPILLGAWVDQRLGIKGPFVILGAVIGFSAGLWSLLRLVEPLRHDSRRPRNKKQPPPNSRP